jgi:NADH-quinone oxidoreductase subunit E
MADAVHIPDEAETRARWGSFAWTADNAEQAKKVIARYPAGRQQSAVMPLLDLAQRQVGAEENTQGWLPIPVMEYIAEYLAMPVIRVVEVASFYTMYNIKPQGRFKITICTNLPCALSGANAAAKHLQDKLGVGFGATTPDGKFTLKEGECMGACGDAPVLIVNDRRMCSFMNDARLDELVDELSQAADRGEGRPGFPKA